MSEISKLLEYASEVGASDIHLVAGEKPVFRQFGDLVEGCSDVLTSESIHAILQEIVPKRLLASFENEHEVDFSMDEPGIGRYRANAFFEKGRPSLALRAVRTEVPSFEELGLPAIIGDIALCRRGILLASGPTGCGKSTTLARMIQHINENDHMRVITIEDPIEFLFTNKRSIILQREIGTDTPSFAHALRSTLRQDPDIIMIGEMRDADSFQAALTMAETGHLVLSTLHTDTASQAISRILNFFPIEQRDVIRMSLADNLRGVVCQRLLQTVKGELAPTVEILLNTPIVRKLLLTGGLEKLHSAIETDAESGMMTFNDSLHQLIKAGTITEETGLASSNNPSQLQMYLEGIHLDEGKRIISGG